MVIRQKEGKRCFLSNREKINKATQGGSVFPGNEGGETEQFPRKSKEGKENLLRKDKSGKGGGTIPTSCGPQPVENGLEKRGTNLTEKAMNVAHESDGDEEREKAGVEGSTPGVGRGTAY